MGARRLAGSISSSGEGGGSSLAGTPGTRPLLVVLIGLVCFAGLGSVASGGQPAKTREAHPGGKKPGGGSGADGVADAELADV